MTIEGIVLYSGLAAIIYLLLTVVARLTTISNRLMMISEDARDMRGTVDEIYAVVVNSNDNSHRTAANDS